MPGPFLPFPFLYSTPMLARVADNLYWMGRYIERTEHMARFTKIQYFYSLDGPLVRQWDRVLGSILQMAGLPPAAGPLVEAEVLYHIALDPEQPVSIIASVTHARENARGTRDLISKELWEAINKYYHFVQQYPVDRFQRRGLNEFAGRVVEHCAIIRGSVENTLLHDEVWAFIKLGAFLERAIQVLRVLRTKLQDLAALHQQAGLTPAVENYQLTTLLGATEAFDMSRRYYQAAPTQAQVVEFLVLNRSFPRSLINCLTQVETHIHQLDPAKDSPHDSVSFAVSKLVAQLRYLTLADISADTPAFLDLMLEEVYTLAGQLSQTYLKH